MDQLSFEGSGSPPIHRLPEYIFRVIFTIVTKVKAEEWGSEEFHSPIISLQLLHVCRLWRLILKDIPRLWTHIHPANVDFAFFSLELAGEMDLDFNLGIRCCNAARRQEVFSPLVFDLIRDNIHRVVQLRVHRGFTYELMEFFQKVTAPKLHTAHFDLHRRSTEFIPFGGSCPNLRNVSWERYTPPLNTIFWDNLTGLSLLYTHSETQGLEYRHWEAILKRNPHLQSIILKGNVIGPIRSSWNGAEPHVVIRMTHLEYLVLEGMSAQVAITVLNSVSPPQLSTLTLDYLTADYALPGLEGCEIFSQRLRTADHLRLFTNRDGRLSLQISTATESADAPIITSIKVHTQWPSWLTGIVRHMRSLKKLSIAGHLQSRTIPCLYNIPIPGITVLKLEEYTRLPYLGYFMVHKSLPCLEEIALPPLEYPPEADHMECIKSLLSNAKLPRITVLTGKMEPDILVVFKIFSRETRITLNIQ